MSDLPISEDPMFKNIGRKRFGCLLRMTIMGLISVGLVTALGFWLVKDTVRGEEEVGAIFNADYTAEVPDHFYPYTYSKFFGSYLIVFWSKEHMLDEFRTSSVFGIHWRSDWEGKQIEDIEQKTLEELEGRLDRNEFRTTHYEAIQVERDGETLTIHRFRGLSRIDESFAEAVTCYRYMMGPDGPVQVMTLGLAETFPEQDQIDLVASVSSKKPFVTSAQKGQP